MFFRNLKNYFGYHTVTVEKFSEDELKKMEKDFYISRTGMDMVEKRIEEPLPKGLPPIFTESYEKNKKSASEYEELDEQLNTFRRASNNMEEYRKKVETIHYANCTTLACFMCDALVRNKYNAKVFGIGAEHHFVIAKTEEPYKFLIIEPWAGMQFTVKLKENVTDLEKLSIESRLEICKAHFEATNLYPEFLYKQPYDEIMAYKIDAETKNKLLTQAYSILPTEEYFEFNNVNLSKPAK